MEKERWKRCNYCGIIFDADTDYCPKRGLLENNPKHKVKVVEIDLLEVKRLYQEGKVWTRHIAEIERRLKSL